MRRSGMISYSGLRLPISFWPIGVPTSPEMMPFTRIAGARSAAACLVKELIAPFDTEYAAPPGLERSPDPAEMLMITPPPWAFISLPACCTQRKYPVKIDRHDPVPLFKRDVEHAAFRRLGNAVDQNIEPSMLFFNML